MTKHSLLKLQTALLNIKNQVQSFSGITGVPKQGIYERMTLFAVCLKAVFLK